MIGKLTPRADSPQNEVGYMRALGLCLLAGTCAMGVILATPTPATSRPSGLSFGLGQFGAAAVEEVRHRRYRYPHRRYYQPYYGPYHRRYYGYYGWPYHYRPHYYDPGWSRGFNATEQLLQCLFSQPFVTCG
jgi:hypothetical protein